VPDLLRRGMAWLADQSRQQLAQQVQYARGAQSVPLQATFGQSLLKLEDGQGHLVMEWTDADIVIAAADLILGGVLTQPQRGDTVTTVYRGNTLAYEVLPIKGEPPWRWSDPFNTQMRVHLKLVSVTAGVGR